MERELLEEFEAARKAADAAPAEAARCVDALRRLRGARVTTAALVSTQVGKRLRYLTKHPHSVIKATASDLLGYWKRVVLEEAEKKNGTPRHGKSNNSVVKVEKAEPMKVEKVSVSPSGNVNKSDMDVSVMKSEGVKAENRDKVRGILADAFSKVSEETRKDDKEEVRNILDEVEACDPFRVAMTVECALFQKLGSSSGPNKPKYRSLLFNLKADNNTDFRRRVLLGQVRSETIADLTPAEMASDTRKLQNKKIEEKALFDCERGGAPKATTDQFKCGRCGQRKTTYYQLQTRSADEPMTTFVTCVNCNNHWKFC